MEEIKSISKFDEKKDIATAAKVGAEIMREHCAACRIEALRQTIEAESNAWWNGLHPEH